MKNLMRNTTSHHGRVLAGILIGLLSTRAVVPAIAAPGDTLAAPQPLAMNTIDQPAGSAFEYLSIAGSAFHPLDNSTTYSYPGSGCIAKTGGANTLFAHKVNLPQGAVARYLRLYYYDASAQNVIAFFTTYDGAGNFNERTSASSASGSTGYGFEVSSDMNFTVDRFTSAVNVVVNLGNQNNDTLRFCGVRIAYDLPITDRIFANGFDLTPL